MTLTAGAPLGLHEILAPFGVGGMEDPPDSITVVLNWTAALPH